MEWAQWWLMLAGVIGAFGATMSLLAQITSRLLKRVGSPNQKTDRGPAEGGRWL
jgi:hypothetical protein